MSSFYARWAQKRKKRPLLGSTGVKAAHKHIDEIDSSSLNTKESKYSKAFCSLSMVFILAKYLIYSAHDANIGLVMYFFRFSIFF